MYIVTMTWKAVVSPLILASSSFPTREHHQILKKKRRCLDMKTQKTIFNDPIHGHMELHPLLVKIIDTPQFQRLRRIKQLGGAYLVYPGASHNRFEHSLGVAYLAGCLVKTLHDNQPELKITKRDFLCVQIAGLCHDLGHGPFSHVFDGLVIPETKKINRSKGLPDDIPEKWKHEQMSVLMFDDIVKSLKAENEDVLKEHGLDDKDVTFIKELIEGAKTSEWTHKGRDEEKSFLYEIVANKQNGIDVDKWDYFARDCHHLGIQNSFDHQRLLKFARVCEVNGRKHICFRDKISATLMFVCLTGADNVYDMFRTRYTLHRQAYQHKIANSIKKPDLKFSISLAEALIRADCNLHEGKPEDMLKISEAIKTADDYSKLTDEIFEQISSSTADNLKEARDILNKIVRRKLPKFDGEARLTEKNKSKEELTKTWKAAVERYKATDPTVSLNAEDFSVYVVDLDHGMKDRNPIEYVYFYSKRKPNEASAIKDYQTGFRPGTNQHNIPELFLGGEHISIQDLKKRDDIKQEQQVQKYLSKDVPEYPTPVEFHVTEVSHVTNMSSVQKIWNSGGFMGRDSKLLSWWSLKINEADIRAAEKRFLESKGLTAPQPFLSRFTTSPAFDNKISRYGNFRFTFPLAELMEAYKQQMCDGEEPVLRVYGTKLFKQKIEYIILVHSPKLLEFSHLPELASSPCVGYDGHRIIWRAQAICETHNIQLLKNGNQALIQELEKKEFYVWDQGYVDSPAVFSAAVQRTLAKMTDLPSTVCVLQYADDLIISSETREDCEKASIIVCNVLVQAGFKALKEKLQWVQPKVTYLGHIIMPGLQAISTDRVQMIRKMKSPQTVQQLQSFLGLVNYCRSWIPDKYLRSLIDRKAPPKTPLMRTDEAEMHFVALKKAITTAPSLGLPSFEREFHLHVRETEGVAMGVLLQQHGSTYRPVAYLSKKLDNVAAGMPACLRAVSAAAIVVQMAEKIVLSHPMIVCTSHQSSPSSFSRPILMG
ncbi:deoxynucleoside triphosphate triphosphohydrolase SAMHD1-like protein [Labeo rohita]|uniref:ribonuclease H n=1 Tax=Labeo rohita TaxID=84645 RepID=A0A498NST7_LABRO|nr:deoxynucleoside triphosphate triphosphohydrolase SAMHD1-like protein [Labeo rohita]